MNAEMPRPVEMSERFAQSEQVTRCVTTHWFRFAEGREERESDGCRLAALDARVAETGGDLRELLVAYVSQPEFLVRSGGE